MQVNSEAAIRNGEELLRKFGSWTKVFQEQRKLDEQKRVKAEKEAEASRRA